MIKVKDYNLGNYIVPHDTLHGTCIDIGCNVGSFMQKYINHFSKIVYYEPIKECYDLCVNFARQHAHVCGYNLAVWKTSNELVTMLQHFNQDSGSSAIESDALNYEWHNKSVIQTVNTISIKDILDSIPKDIDYCKVDCENSEYYIFMNQKIDRIKYIGMEIHHQMGREKQEELLSYILQTHDLISGGAAYTNYNREILFKRK